MSETIINDITYEVRPLEFGEPVDGKYRCVAVVLSGAVLHNKKLGDFRIDLNTLVYHKSRVPVDYNHEAENVIGYAENFRVTDAGLVADVYIIEFVQKVCDIITLIKNGTPFEISPSINEEEGTLTVIDGVNVYENVPLRGIAVCPFGTDRFTSLTLLKEETMTKNITTNLADETQDNKETPKVKDPDLAEFIDVYGTEKGLELWQSGADIADIRTLKELIDKYGVPGKPEPPAQTTELSEGNTPPEDKKETGTTDLKAVIIALKSEMTALKADLTKVRAAVPRGEASPVHHGYNSGEGAKEKTGSPESRYAMKLKK